MESNPSEPSSSSALPAPSDAPITAEPPIVREDPAPATAVPTSLPPDDVAAIDELGKTYRALKEELGKVIIGQEEVIEQLAICLFGRGHALLMGVPGLAKTLLVSTVAETMNLSFNRI